MRHAAIIAFLFAISPAVPAFAQDQTAAAAQILSCESVRGDKARLKCFEKALPALRDAFPGAESIANARADEAHQAAKEDAKKDFGLPPAVAQASKPFEEKEFGAEQLPRDEKIDEENVNSITAGIVDIGRSLNGKIIVFLDNGQVWRQLDSDKSTPYIRKNFEGLTATVKRGFLGSYLVRIERTHDAFKARRVK